MTLTKLQISNRLATWAEAERRTAERRQELLDLKKQDAAEEDEQEIAELKAEVRQRFEKHDVLRQAVQKLRGVRR